jgi:hypothetical protein
MNWQPEMQGLASLEWNYFEARKVELCVTPETAFEITGGQSFDSPPYAAYQRFKKTEFFKSRPSSTTLSLSKQEAGQLWTGIRGVLWPTVKDNQLTQNQQADVNQLFFHTVSSGSTCYNLAFLTIDKNFLKKRNELTRDLGVTVLTPSEACEEYRPSYNLYTPSDREVSYVWQRQQDYLTTLSATSRSGL